MVVVLAVIIAAVARTVIHAAEVVLEVALITAGAVLGLAAIGGTAYVALRLHRSHVRTRQEVSWHTPRTLGASERLSAPRRRAIEAPRAVTGGLVVSDEITERR